MFDNFDLCIDKNNNQQYYAFTPNMLCSNITIKIDNDIVYLLANAHRLLGLLEGMSGFLPNIAAIESVLIHNEAFWSCKIDKIETSLNDVLDSLKKVNHKTLPVKNYVSALNYGITNINSASYNNALLCDIHKILMNGISDDNIGKFRAIQTYINKVVIINFPSYNPPIPKKLAPLLLDLERFIQTENNMDILIKTALAHYQFEAVHPFMSGNGRLGRILIYMMLSVEKILSKLLLCLSRYLCLNKIEYFERIDEVHIKNNYNRWIKFFLKAVVTSAKESLNAIDNWLILREKNIAQIASLSKQGQSANKLYDVIERFPISDIKTLSRESSLSYNTTADAVNKLISLNILKQTNSMTRNRAYSYTDFLDCFSHISQK